MAAWDAGERDGAHVYLRTSAGIRELAFSDEPLHVAGWWPNGRGLLLRHDWGYCNSCNADGTRLASLSIGGRFTDLGVFNAHAGGYAWSPLGDLLVGTGGDRFVATGDPRVVVCKVADASCAEISRPANAVDLTPAWSPDGHFFVFARGIKPTGTTEGEIATWQDRLDLWIARADGSGQKKLQTPGGSYPTWSADGRAVSFIHAGERWRHDLYSGQNVSTGEKPTGARTRGWINYSAALAG
ncbi:MAG: hypothetical protein PVS3B2_14000 [Candidatus Dormibacteraceae bacterium]